MCPQRMTDKCFRKCIGKPGGSLDNSEQVRHPGNPGMVRGAGSGASGIKDLRVRGLQPQPTEEFCACAG